MHLTLCLRGIDRHLALNGYHVYQHLADADLRKIRVYGLFPPFGGQFLWVGLPFITPELGDRIGALKCGLVMFKHRLQSRDDETVMLLQSHRHSWQNGKVCMYNRQRKWNSWVLPWVILYSNDPGVFVRFSPWNNSSEFLSEWKELINSDNYWYYYKLYFWYTMKIHTVVRRPKETCKQLGACYVQQETPGLTHILPRWCSGFMHHQYQYTGPTAT